MPGEDPSSKTILVVDDEETICDFFSFLLSRERFGVVTALNGRSAIEKLKSGRKIDLIVLDLMMPGPGGYEVLRELQQGDSARIPILIATSRALDPGTVEMLKLESNVVGFWEKPIDQERFVREVHATLGTAKPGT